MLVIAIVVIIAVVVILAVVLSTAAAMRSDQVKIIVSYPGDWSGTYSDGSSLHSWSGWGEDSVIVTRSSATATIYAMAMSTEFGSSGTMTLKIIGPDGHTLKEASGSSAFNLVMVSWTPS